MRASTTPRREARRTIIAVIAALLTGCSGGGGGDNTPAPTVQLQASRSNPADDDAHLVDHQRRYVPVRRLGGTRLVSGSRRRPATMTTTFTLQCTGHGGRRPAPPSPCWARRAPWRKPARADDFASDSGVNPFAAAPNDSGQAQVTAR
jgi:hypothetical protein